MSGHRFSLVWKVRLAWDADRRFPLNLSCSFGLYLGEGLALRRYGKLAR